MNRLRELREKAKLTQQELAEKLNISRQAYNFYENEKRDLYPKILIQLSDYYNVSIDYILYRTNHRNYGDGNDFIITTQEIEHIKKYRALDERGKEAMDETLEREYVNSLKTMSNVDYGKASA